MRLSCSGAQFSMIWQFILRMTIGVRKGSVPVSHMVELVLIICSFDFTLSVQSAGHIRPAPHFQFFGNARHGLYRAVPRPGRFHKIQRMERLGVAHRHLGKSWNAEMLKAKAGMRNRSGPFIFFRRFFAVPIPPSSPPVARPVHREFHP